MPAISFQQGVALAMGAYIDPANSTNNKRFTLVEATANRNRNGVFAVNIRTGLVDNRLSALFHGRNGAGTDVGTLDFTNNSAGTQLGNLPDQAYSLTTTSTAANDIELTGYDLAFTSGVIAAHKQLDYRVGGDIVGNGTVSKIERNYHRTGLAIWNKLKK
jgi:hypothetical protein